MVGEWKERDRVATHERGADRSLDGDRSVPRLEGRHVAALGQLDADRVGASFVLVVMRELRAEPSRLHTDDGVGARVEGLFLPEDLDADDEFLELGRATREGFPDDERQETFEAVSRAERVTAQDAVELVEDRPVDVRGGGCGGQTIRLSLPWHRRFGHGPSLRVLHVKVLGAECRVPGAGAECWC